VFDGAPRELGTDAGFEAAVHARLHQGEPSPAQPAEAAAGPGPQDAAPLPPDGHA
jgi:hypothetical protein